MDKWFMGVLVKEKKVLEGEIKKEEQRVTDNQMIQTFSRNENEKNITTYRSDEKQEAINKTNMSFEQKRAEFKAMVENHEKRQQLSQEVKPAVSVDALRPQYNNLDIIQKNKESKKKIQMELAEISKTIRETQQTIKEIYQFEPCRQLCDLAINLHQRVYRSVEEVQEDLDYVIEAFGISKFETVPDEIFDAKYHDQVVSNFYDARGRKIDQVYSPGFQIDGEILVKAQVSVK